MMSEAMVKKSSSKDSSVLFTIAVAVYNVEKTLLKRCLDSITHIKDMSYEVLLVDDGSTDECSLICDKYAAHYDRVRALHTANQGLSGARNVGIDNARGAWLIFVDGDDYVPEGFLEYVPCVVEQHSDSDIIYVEYKESWDITDKIERTNGSLSDINMPSCFELAKSIVSYTEFFFGIDNIKFASSWGKIFRRNFIVDHDCNFILGVLKSQDRVFMTELLSYHPKLAAVDIEGYVYVNNLGSITHHHDPQMADKLAHTYQIMIQTIRKYYQGNELDEMLSACTVYMRCVFMYNALDALYLCPNGNENYHHEFREFVSYVQGFFPCIDACNLRCIYGIRNKYLLWCLKHRLYRCAYYVSMLMMDVYLFVRTHT